MQILIVGFGFLTILSSFYALKRWGFTAFLIVAIPMVGAFIALTKMGV